MKFISFLIAPLLVLSGLIVSGMVNYVLPPAFMEFSAYAAKSIWQVDAIWLLTAAAIVAFLVMKYGAHSASRAYWKKLKRWQTNDRSIQDNGLIAHS